MANYRGKWRTNWFPVRDEAAFLAWAASLPISVETQEHTPDGIRRFALFPDPVVEPAGIPTAYFDDNRDIIEMSLPHELAPHLPEDVVAVFEEVGSEKLRYLVGYALAVDHQGRTLSVSLDDLPQKVRRYWHREVSDAAY